MSLVFKLRLYSFIAGLVVATIVYSVAILVSGCGSLGCTDSTLGKTRFFMLYVLLPFLITYLSTLFYLAYKTLNLNSKTVREENSQVKKSVANSKSFQNKKTVNKKSREKQTLRSKK